ncbi:hypothetical protein [Variovorax terrae]|uniref:Uncharacterized protein n=1 Tax=Variovorax terrae TaxID=2923278 RepID=A0A9X2AMW3_9BURK|nr:hypothetical protein [Variovorax terrae]MCJ0763789.1 hypothetical protein [Variovorax terrae]
MNTPNDSPTAAQDEEYGLPDSEALLAGTLALMTGHAQACCDGRKAVLARKIVSNLFLLSQHPVLTPAFRSMLWSLHGRWTQPLPPPEAHAPGTAGPLRGLWHAAPEVVQ